MNKRVRNLLGRFAKLNQREQQQFTAEVIRRSTWPPMTDGELNQCADELFLELDRSEASDTPRARRGDAR